MKRRWPTSSPATWRGEQFEVTVCHSGAEALTVAREVDPDVVVLDLGFCPVSTGWRSAASCGRFRMPTWSC